MPIYNTPGYTIISMIYGIPLDAKVSTFLLETCNTTNNSFGFTTPDNPINGQTFRFIDINGYLSTCNFTLRGDTSTNLVEYQTIKTYANNFLSRKLIYSGNGASGYWICLSTSVTG